MPVILNRISGGRDVRLPWIELSLLISLDPWPFINFTSLFDSSFLSFPLFQCLFSFFFFILLLSTAAFRYTFARIVSRICVIYDFKWPMKRIRTNDRY